jgi:GNAT superfamily N-acetyltransferase
MTSPNFSVNEAVEMMRGIDPGRAAQWSASFFRWKHFENPFGESLGLTSVDDDGALIALRMFQRWGLERRGFPVEAVRAVDTATAPRAQGRGLFRKLTLAAVDIAIADDVDLVFNTPNEKSGAGYLKMGWVEVGRPGVFLRATRPPLRGRLDGDDVDPVALARAWSMTTPGHRLRTQKDERYFRWRYLDIPGFRYRQHRVGDAIVVFRRQSRRGVPEVTMVEVVHANSVRGVRDAARAVGDVVRHGGAFLVSAMASAPSSTVAALLRHGFVWTPLGPRLFTRPLAMRRIDPLPSATADWGLEIGDLELF